MPRSAAACSPGMLLTARELLESGRAFSRADIREFPELNPVENIWQFLRDNWLSNRVFKSLR